ncbi:hypothetical protein DRO51_05200 [Candidatus Bathyarchaeota archaeon]|nr:MAG: hypothetical protein DRO51_05200 [Candidatus Bathyarchaeota archaeon]
MCAPVSITTANVMMTVGSGMQALLVSQILALTTVVGILAFKAVGMVKQVGLKLQERVGVKLGFMKSLGKR